MDIYKLYRAFWDFAFENTDKIKPNHVAIYSFAIEHCNRLGWKQKFGFPATMVLEATGIKSYSVYKKTFDELVEFGFFEVIQYSKNQYSSNIIALKENYKANSKALDKALIKHVSKQSESTLESIDSIDKQINNIPINNIPNKSGGNPPTPTSNLKSTMEGRKSKFIEDLTPFVEVYGKDMVRDFFNYWSELNKSQTKMLWELKPTFEISKRLLTWASREKTFSPKQENTNSVKINL